MIRNFSFYLIFISRQIFAQYTCLEIDTSLYLISLNFSCFYLYCSLVKRGGMTKTKEDWLLEKAEKNDIKAVLGILKQGVNVETKDKDDYTPLHIAAERGYSELAFLLLFVYSADPDVKTKHGVTPLHIAALYGHEGIINILLENGANPNPYDLLGYNPLNLAHGHGYLNIVELLEAYGVSNDTGSPFPEEKFMYSVSGSSNSLDSI